MTDKGPFVSVPNEIVCENPSVLPDVDSPENLEYIGRSASHSIYWNKTSPSFGLLCGSSVRLHASNHFPTILVLHGHAKVSFLTHYRLIISIYWPISLPNLI